MQKRVSLNGSDWLMVEVPDSICNVQIREENSKEVLTYWENGDFHTDGKWHDIELPDKNNLIIGGGSAITEDEWKEIVEKKEDGYECYDLIIYGAPYSPMETATQSGHSLIRKCGFEPNKVVILKINS